MAVPFYDHHKLYLRRKTEIDAAIARVIASGRLDWGPEVPAFEAEFAALNGAAHAVTANSGTAALKIALLALGLGPGDEVITVSNTDIGCSSAIRFTGADVVWVDIEPVSRTIEVAAIAAAITPRTRAIMAVDMFGHPADIPAIMALAQAHGLVVIEDACLALGATIGGTTVGSLSTVTCFSFAPSKHLGSYGSGGCALTQDANLAETMRKIAAYGQERIRHYGMHTGALDTGLWHETEGLNERLDEIQAAILRARMVDLAPNLATRRAQAQRYATELAGLGLDLPQTLPGYEHAWRNYVIETDDRDGLRQRLSARGIPTNLSYAPPMHVQPVYRPLGIAEGSLPATERSCARLLGLPIGPQIDPDQQTEIISAIRACV